MAQIAKAKPGVLALHSIERTMDAPNEAWKVAFRTSRRELLASTAGHDTAYLTNRGKALVWDALFCTVQMKALIRERHILTVVGAVENSQGEVQQMTLCVAD